MTKIIIIRPFATWPVILEPTLNYTVHNPLPIERRNLDILSAIKYFESCAETRKPLQLAMLHPCINNRRK